MAEKDPPRGVLTLFRQGLIHYYWDGLWIMRKLALPVTVTTLVAGVFGAFLRWLQLRTIYEAETGLTRPWAGVTVVFVALILALAAALLCLVFFRLRSRLLEKPLAAEQALRASTAVPGALIWLLGAALAAGGLVLLFSHKNAATQLENVLETLFRAGCIIAGACVLCLPQRGGEKQENAYPGRPASVVLTLFFCVWLVYSYVINSRDPVYWNFLPEVLAVAASTLAFYYITAYFFGAAKPCSAVFWANFAAFLNICTLFDPMDTATKLLHAAISGTLLLLGFLLLENMRESPAEPEVTG